ncbi:MAG: helix-turn-helix domain-containing protein, partial [Suilimivivens sp.]
IMGGDIMDNFVAQKSNINKLQEEAALLKEKLDSLNAESLAINYLTDHRSDSILYCINAPFQITYEYCSGGNDDDYLNILQLHESGSLYYQKSVGLHNKLDFFHYPPHYHDYYEFMIVLESTVTQQIEGTNYSYPAGTCCLINRNLSHKEYFHPKSRVLYLGFSINLLKELFDHAMKSAMKQELDIFQTDMYQFLANDLKKPGQRAYLDFLPLYRNEDGPARLKELTEAVIHNLMFPVFGSSYAILGLLCEILCYISSPANYHCTLAEISQKNDYLIFERINHLLTENDGRLSRQEISKKINYSGDYINRIVNKYTGMSLHDYGMSLCIKKAAKQIASTDQSISDIAISLGFTNRTYFYKIFFKKYGVTPKEYRKQAKNKSKDLFLNDK